MAADGAKFSRCDREGSSTPKSHASGKARWIGECGLSCGPSIEEPMVPALEKLRANI
ncbi:hypothetical protein WN51_08202 [Melipona quadrifasciata]|uniref:Uncharacterized protein n=1 Tax=Melipona quadrifasciata TaxID=166423 RepID=A0A0N0BBS7_9HYME|nr:hypothetical protein WN51_08202 [Melipona quadrifasciata]